MLHSPDELDIRDVGAPSRARFVAALHATEATFRAGVIASRFEQVYDSA